MSNNHPDDIFKYMKTTSYRFDRGRSDGVYNSGNSSLFVSENQFNLLEQ